MIGGGKWESQDKELHGVYINFDGEEKSSTVNNTGSGYLADFSGAFLKSKDDLYLTVN